MERSRRRRLDAQGWREVLDRFSGSGLPVGTFCEREGLGVASFYRWRQVLDNTATAPMLAKSAEAFVELGTIDPGAALGRLDVKLDLGGGLTLHLVRG